MIRYAIPIPPVGPKKLFDMADVTYKGQTFVHCRSCNSYGRPRWAHMCDPLKTNWLKHPQDILDQEAKPLLPGVGTMPRHWTELRIAYGVPSPSSQQPPVPFPDSKRTREGMIDYLKVNLPSELPPFDPGKEHF